MRAPRAGDADDGTAREVALSSAALRHTLTAARLLDRTVRLNGRELRLGRDGAVPRTAGVPVPAGRVRLEPASITFLAVPDAGNAACN